MPTRSAGPNTRAWFPSTEPTALIVSGGADHRVMVAPGLRHHVQRYVAMMVSNIDTVIDGWQPDSG